MGINSFKHGQPQGVAPTGLSLSDVVQSDDYSRAGFYFVPVCVQNRKCLFGKIAQGDVRMNQAGRMVQTIWDAIPSHYPGIEIDASIVMPNHFHGIIVTVGAGPCACPDRDNHKP